MYKKIIALTAMLFGMTCWAGDSAPFLLDTKDPMVKTDGEVSFSYNSSWIGGEPTAEVVISVDESEFLRVSGAGYFSWTPTSGGEHKLTYTTYIDGVVQDEVYEAVVWVGDWRYELNEGKATIIGTVHVSGDITIPSEIDGYPVIAVDENTFRGCAGLKSVTMPLAILDDSVGMANLFPDSYVAITNVVLTGEGERIPPGAFAGCTSLQNVEVPESVTQIGTGAFNGCEALADDDGFLVVGNVLCGYFEDGGCIAIPDGVVAIEAKAFYGCDDLTEVIIPSTVRRIGAEAFANCASLERVVIPSSVTDIGSDAFSGCNSIKDATLPGWKCGINFSNVTNLVIAEGTTNIAKYAFESCFSLESVTMPDSVTSIGYGAFEDCSSLTSVMIPDSVTSIGYDAFYGCSSLTSVAIPDSVTSIGNGVFWGCSSLASVTIPDSVTSIGANAFSGCGEFIVSKNNEVYSSNRGLLLSKDGKNLIAGSDNGIVTIPDGVANICDYAFHECDELVSVAIPDSVISIGNDVFNGCSSLREIRVSVDNEHYSSMNGLLLSKDGKTLIAGINGDVVIPECVTSIGVRAFNGCSTLESVVIPVNVTSIGKYPFDGCSSLKNVTVPGWQCRIDFSIVTNLVISEGTTRIRDYAFENCSSFMCVTIPDSVLTIGVRAFDECLSLKNITIPNSVTNIGDSAFSYCSSLTSVIIPNSVTSIGARTFYGCKPTDVTVPGWKCGIDFGIVTNLVITDGTESISDNAFTNCSSLVSVEMPYSVTNIGNTAFNGCSALKIVDMPVAFMGLVDFDGCPDDMLVNYHCRVSFDAAGGVLGESSLPNGEGGFIKDVIYDSLYGELPTASCEGYVFLGWTLDGESVDADTIVKTAGDHTLAAAWGIQIGNGIWATTICDDAIVLDEPLVAPTGEVEIPVEIAGRPIVGITEDAFLGNDDITGIRIPEGVTDIEEGAFDGCTGIRSVHIPYVTDKPQWMANNFPDSYITITNVVLGGSVGRIGDSFFTGCEALSSVSISAGLTNIVRTAFSGCSNIASVIWCVTNECVDCGISFNELFADSKASLRVLSFAEGVVSLPDGCLTGLEAVERVELPSTLEKFGDNDLRSLSKVENGFWIEQGWVLGYMGTASGTVEIPEGVKGIASYAFEGQTLLDNVTLPSTLKYVGVNAFKSCTNLEDIDMPEGVVRVEDGAFRNCTYAQTVKLPSTLQEIGDSAFENCTSFSGVECPDALKIIGEGAFSNCWRMLSVSLPVGLESVGTNAFLDCRRLIGVSTPTHLNTMKVLFPSAYANLTTVEVAEGENALVSGVFAGCAALTEVDIPDGIRVIPEDAFVGCLAVQSFNLSNTITNIGARAFSGLMQMTSFAFPAEVETIADEAFAGCVNLASLSLPEGVKHIGSRAFDGLALLARADIPGTVVEMGEAPFAGCGQIRAVSMPGNVATVKSLFPDAYGEIVSASVTVGTTCVGERLFADCSKLTSVDLPSTLVEIEECAFENCALLADAGIPAGVERLGEGAFLNCASLAKIALPNGLVTVPYQAFAGCEALAEIVIPENVSELEDSVFWGCSRLSKVYFVGNAPSCTASSYDGVPASLVTYVENGSTGWDGIETSKTLPEFWPEGTSNLITYWTPNRYDVTFDLSGGGDAFDVEQVTGTTYFLPPDPERQGAVFDGWWTSADGGARVTAVTSVDLTRPHTFYARWKYNTYSVVFDANGGSGEMDEQRLTVETPAQLAENGFTRPGYEFLGWATAPDGEVVYSDKAEVVNLAYDNNAIVTLYAVWSEREWTWADAVNAVSSGLVFSGDVNNDAEWAIDHSTSHDGVASLRSGVIGASAEYPERTMSTVKTEVVGEGIGEFWWKVNCEEMDAEYDEWYDYVVFTIDGEEVAKIAGDSGWQKVEYIIAGAGKHTLAWTFTRDDYDEEGAGWENAAWLDEFVWAPNPVTVMFDAGGADGDVPDPVVKYAGYELPLPGAGTLNNGEYAFMGWSDGETTYQAGGTYVFGSVDVTLTAVWELKVWTFAEAADVANISFTTGGDVNWAVDTSVGYTNSVSVKSGAITNGESTWIETKVNGAGTLTFRWKVMGGQYRNNPFAYAKVVVDDAEMAYEYLTDGWEEVSLTIEGNKEHTIRWTYLRTSTRTAEGDCAWIDAVVWTSAATSDVMVDVGGGKSVVMPTEWIDKYDSIVTAAGGDKAAALMRTAANGRKVWECFMLGVDPTKADDDFKITRFWMDGGKPMFEFSHSIDGAGNSFVPRLKVKGKAKLSDGWSDVPDGGNPSFRFFTVEVVLP